MMFQPFGGDKCARRDHGAHREIDLFGNDDDCFAQRYDADESRRKGDLLQISSLQKAWFTGGHRCTDDREGQYEAQFRNSDQAPEETGARIAGHRNRCRINDSSQWAKRRIRAVFSACVSGSQQHGLTIERSTWRLGSDMTAAKDDDSIGHSHDFLCVVANEDDGHSLGR
jgi:hypothetical protein